MLLKFIPESGVSKSFAALERHNQKYPVTPSKVPNAILPVKSIKNRGLLATSIMTDMDKSPTRKKRQRLR